MKSSEDDLKKKGGLVLTRTVGQAVFIENGLVEVWVTEIKGQNVKLKFVGNCQVDRLERLEPVENE